MLAPYSRWMFRGEWEPEMYCSWKKFDISPYLLQYTAASLHRVSGENLWDWGRRRPA